MALILESFGFIMIAGNHDKTEVKAIGPLIPSGVALKPPRAIDKS